MKYRRKETFRYQFEEPLDCQFRIIKVAGKEFTSKNGKASIYDISEGGLKLTTPLEIPIDNQEIEIEISFKLNKEVLILTGNLLWAKNMYSNFSYGVQFTIDDSMGDKLIQELKTYTKGIAYIKKKK